MRELKQNTGGDEYDRMVAAGDVLVGSQDMLAGRPVSVASAAKLSDELPALRDGDWR
ncbi:hypothetical protein BH24ACT13_BH24ACT13_00510 [soil metagenome]